MGRSPVCIFLPSPTCFPFLGFLFRPQEEGDPSSFHVVHWNPGEPLACLLCTPVSAGHSSQLPHSFLVICPRSRGARTGHYQALVEGGTSCQSAGFCGPGNICVDPGLSPNPCSLPVPSHPLAWLEGCEHHIHAGFLEREGDSPDFPALLTTLCS